MTHETLPDPGQLSGEALARYLKSVLPFFPEVIGPDKLQTYTVLWLVGIIDLADSIHILLRATKVLSARAILRSLIEAHAKLSWSLLPPESHDRLLRFLANDADWVREYEGTYKNALARNVPLPSYASKNVAERVTSLEDEMKSLGISKTQRVPDPAEMMLTFGEPVMYWSYKALSDAVHPSSGIVNDLFDLRDVPAPLRGTRNPMKYAEILELTVQAVARSLRVAQPVLGFDADALRKATSPAAEEVANLVAALGGGDRQPSSE